MPNLMHKAAVGAYRQHFYPKGLEFPIPDGDRRQLGGSNKSKVPRIEAEDYPFSFVIAEFDRLKAYTGSSTSKRGQVHH